MPCCPPFPVTCAATHHPEVHGQKHYADHKVSDKLVAVEQLADQVVDERRGLGAGGRARQRWRAAHEAIKGHAASPACFTITGRCNMIRAMQRGEGPGCHTLNAKWQMNATGCLGAGTSPCCCTGSICELIVLPDAQVLRVPSAC